MSRSRHEATVRPARHRHESRQAATAKSFTPQELNRLVSPRLGIRKGRKKSKRMRPIIFLDRKSRSCDVQIPENGIFGTASNLASTPVEESFLRPRARARTPARPRLGRTVEKDEVGRARALQLIYSEGMMKRMRDVKHRFYEPPRQTSVFDSDCGSLISGVSYRALPLAPPCSSCPLDGPFDVPRD